MCLSKDWLSFAITLHRVHVKSEGVFGLRFLVTGEDLPTGCFSAHVLKERAEMSLVTRGVEACLDAMLVFDLLFIELVLHLLEA